MQSIYGTYGRPFCASTLHFSVEFSPLLLLLFRHLLLLTFFCSVCILGLVHFEMWTKTLLDAEWKSASFANNSITITNDNNINIHIHINVSLLFFSKKPPAPEKLLFRLDVNIYTYTHINSTHSLIHIYMYKHVPVVCYQLYHRTFFPSNIFIIFHSSHSILMVSWWSCCCFYCCWKLLKNDTHTHTPACIHTNDYSTTIRWMWSVSFYSQESQISSLSRMRASKKQYNKRVNVKRSMEMRMRCCFVVLLSRFIVYAIAKWITDKWCDVLLCV